MADLQEVFARQLRLQIESYGNDPAEMDPERRAEFIRWNVLALTDELHEALGEVGWKPWATSRHLNREAFMKELVDGLHFFVNLCLAAGITADEIVDAYKQKAEVNAQRQVDGYDGVTTKCPQCKRELDTPGCLTLTSKIPHDPNFVPRVCCRGCGYIFSEDQANALARAGVPAPVGP